MVLQAGDKEVIIYVYDKYVLNFT